MVAQTSVGSYWKAPTSAAAAGSVTSTMKACAVNHESALHSNQLELSAPLRVDATEPRSPAPGFFDQSNVRKVRVKSPVPTWTWNLTEDSTTTVTFAYAPVLVCKTPKGTVGLGDAISASGLAAHVAL